MKTRIHNFFDAENVCAKFSFEVFTAGKWRRPVTKVDGVMRPVMFDTEEERDLARKEWSRRKDATCQK